MPDIGAVSNPGSLFALDPQRIHLRNLDAPYGWPLALFRHDEARIPGWGRVERRWEGDRS